MFKYLYYLFNINSNNETHMGNHRPRVDKLLDQLEYNY